MSQYAAIQTHSPDICPITNKTTRAFFENQVSNLPKLQEELGVKIVSNLHLDPAHKVLTIFEAPSAESVRDFLVRGGFMHVFNIEFYLVTPMEEIMKQIENMPTIY